METLNLDKAALAWRLNLPLEDVSAKMNARDGDSSELLAKRLFAELDITSVANLRRYYSMDFQLFGYNAKAYFNETEREKIISEAKNSTTKISLN